MRDIKFRVWNGAEMNRSLFKVHADGQLECDKHVNHIDFEPILMQYTGLKDKNGVEIYEGDILSEPISPVGGKDGGYLYKNREIKWLGAGNGYSLHYPSAASAVIGNIYENPELLESK